MIKPGTIILISEQPQKIVMHDSLENIKVFAGPFLMYLYTKKSFVNYRSFPSAKKITLFHHWFLSPNGERVYTVDRRNIDNLFKPEELWK